MDQVQAQVILDQLRAWQTALHTADRLMHQGGSEEEFRECLRVMIITSTRIITPVAATMVDVANEAKRRTESN